MIPFDKDAILSQQGPRDPFADRFQPRTIDRTPDWFPAQLVVKLGPGMSVIPDRTTAPYGLASPVLKLIASLRKDGLVLLETLWAVGVSPYELLGGAAGSNGLNWAKSNMTSSEYELFWQMVGQLNFTSVKSQFGLNYLSAEKKTEARQYLLLRFSNRTQLDPAIAKIQTWPQINLAYVHKVAYIAPPVESPEPEIEVPNGPAMRKIPKAPPVDWPLQCISSPLLRRPSDRIETIAVLDTGIDLNHPYLAGNVRTLPDSSLLPDPVGHGTRVCSVICSLANRAKTSTWPPNNPEPPMTGLLPNANVLVVQVFGPDPLYSGSDKTRAPWYLQITALTTFLKGLLSDGLSPNTKVLNMSFGSELSQHSIYEHIMALDKNYFVVAAAGNIEARSRNVLYPAAYSRVISVGGLSDRTGYPVSLGTRQSAAIVDSLNRPLIKLGTALIDVFAPGQNIRVCNPTIPISGEPTHVKLSDGTSFAAPMVSAALALQINNKGVADPLALSPGTRNILVWPK